MSMTREQIEAMPAGKEMDLAIARAIGAKPIRFPPQFSADLGAAYDAAWRVAQDQPEVVELLTSSIFGGTFSAEYNEHGEGPLYSAIGDTLPHALCRLVLLAKYTEASR